LDGLTLVTSWVTGEGASRVNIQYLGPDLAMAKDQTSLDDTVLRRGAYTVRFACSVEDIQRCQQLRHRCFVEQAGGEARVGGIETDKFDSLCDHLMVEDQAGLLMCCYRLMSITSGAEINSSYSAQYYDLERLSGYAAPMLELGRFCVDPDIRDPDVLRIAWGMLAAVVDARSVGLLFGCSSFAGIDAGMYRQGLDLLAERHRAPKVWHPDVKASQVVHFGADAQVVTDRKLAMAQVPALLKTYLSMGGWVSDHAVIDTAMNTLHVFTGVEIANIPPARAKALRAVAETT
jgi:putative hemolysin